MKDVEPAASAALKEDVENKSLLLALAALRAAHRNDALEEAAKFAEGMNSHGRFIAEEIRTRLKTQGA